MQHHDGGPVGVALLVDDDAHAVDAIDDALGDPVADCHR